MKSPEGYPGISSAPLELDIGLTGKCTLKCRYCFYAESMEKADDLPTGDWLAFFSEAGGLGVQKVCLSGGEVFIRKDLFEIIDSVIDNKMRYKILSNGTLIDEKTISEFFKGKRRQRLDSIQISVDGSRPDIHDKSRPPRSFEKAIGALRLLKKHGFPVTVRVTINRHNVNDLENIAELLIDDVGLSGFSTNEADYMGSARCNGQDIILSIEERKKAMVTLVSIDERYGGRISAQAGPLTRARMMREISERLERGETSMKGRGTFCSCGGVFNKMAVLHDGTYVPCNMLPTLVMGKMGEVSLKEVWQAHPNINIVRERRKIPITEAEECRGCLYAGFCTGGCPGTVMSKTGMLNSIDPLVCYKKYLQEV